MITAETVTRHELVGLSVRVVDDADDRGEIAGEVVDETTRTLVIETDGRTRTVPKAEATFAVDLPDGGSAVVAGDRLVARPARRTETTGDTIWHSA
jgi:ribonuclease P protein subunit POP4